MNKILILIVFFASHQTYSQITITLEEWRQCVVTDCDLLFEDIAYVEDINNVLEPYAGTWVGNDSGKSYIIEIQEYQSSSFGTVYDDLRLRYEVRDVATNQVIESNLGLNWDDSKINEGSRFRKKDDEYWYTFGYEGITQCGLSGFLFIKHENVSRQGEYLRVFIAGWFIELNGLSEGCSNYDETFPFESMLLTRL